jgi:hypothetical protein
VSAGHTIGKRWSRDSWTRYRQLPSSCNTPSSRVAKAPDVDDESWYLITGPSIARASSAVVLEVGITFGAPFDPELPHAVATSSKATATTLTLADCPLRTNRCKRVARQTHPRWVGITTLTVRSIVLIARTAVHAANDHVG